MTDLRDICRRGRRIGAGLVNGTKVETETGWRRVEQLVPGERIHTFDSGPTVLRGVVRASYGADLPMVYPEGLTLVPGGALGNCEGFYVLPDQCVMFSGSAVQGMTGQDRALVAGRDLAGHGQIGLAMPVDGIEVFRLMFDDEEVVFANTGVLMHCPAPEHESTTESHFHVLDTAAAELLMSCRFLAGRRPAIREREKGITAAL